MAAQGLTVAALCGAVLGLSLIAAQPAWPQAQRSVMAEPAPILRVQVIQRRGNQMPNLEIPQQQEQPGAVVVVILAGQVKASMLGDPFLPSAALRAPILARATTQRDGHLNWQLPATHTWPRHITLMLEVPGGLYLNRFDGSGHFASLQQPEELNNLLTLVDDRGAVY